MTKDDIHLLYEYDRWANNRVLQAVFVLTAEQFTRDLGGSSSVPCETRFCTSSEAHGFVRLAHLMQHLANHSTYHRGQIALMMRQLNVEPLATDFHVFLVEGRRETATAPANQGNLSA
jgi:uncharacterized damage-inducible protein DinB